MWVVPELGLQWAGPHPLAEPQASGVAWALAPSRDEPESYVWASSLGVEGTWKPFGLATLKSRRPPNNDSTYRLPPDSELLSPRVWSDSRDWWETVYEGLVEPLQSQVWTSSIVDALQSVYEVHEAWRDRVYLTIPTALTASGVRLLGRTLREEWVKYLPVMTPICQARAIYYQDPDVRPMA